MTETSEQEVGPIPPVIRTVNRRTSVIVVLSVFLIWGVVVGSISWFKYSSLQSTKKTVERSAAAVYDLELAKGKKKNESTVAYSFEELRKEKGPLKSYRIVSSTCTNNFLAEVKVRAARSRGVNIERCALLNGDSGWYVCFIDNWKDRNKRKGSNLDEMLFGRDSQPKK